MGSRFFLLLVGYATTIRRAQGSTLDAGCIWFDHCYPPERGYGYVAVSRFRTHAGVYHYGRIRRSDWLPVGGDPDYEQIYQGYESFEEAEDPFADAYYEGESGDDAGDPFEDAYSVPPGGAFDDFYADRGGEAVDPFEGAYVDEESSDDGADPFEDAYFDDESGDDAGVPLDGGFYGEDFYADRDADELLSPPAPPDIAYSMFPESELPADEFLLEFLRSPD